VRREEQTIARIYRKSIFKRHNYIAAVVNRNNKKECRVQNKTGFQHLGIFDVKLGLYQI
jgi:L-amino acid N-acyltransferase YncA